MIMRITHLFLAALALSSLISGCASTGGERYLEASPALQKEIDERIANIQFLRGKELYQSLGRLNWIGEPAIPSLLDALGHDDAKTRGAAAFVLGEIRDGRVVPRLRKSLRDPSAEVRYEVAASLVTIGDWDAMPVLIEGLDDPLAINRRRCIQVLKAKVGEDFGFAFDGPLQERKEAIQKWSDWWKASRGGDLL
jgi:HEAT repeat protein